VTDLDSAQIKLAVDAILARTRLPVTPDDYERLLGLYPILQTQCANLRVAGLRNLEPAIIYQPR
jgi:hypothetical protein